MKPESVVVSSHIIDHHRLFFLHHLANYQILYTTWKWSLLKKLFTSKLSSLMKNTQVPMFFKDLQEIFFGRFFVTLWLNVFSHCNSKKMVLWYEMYESHIECVESCENVIFIRYEGIMKKLFLNTAVEQSNINWNCYLWKIIDKRFNQSIVKLCLIFASK